MVLEYPIQTSLETPPYTAERFGKLGNATTHTNSQYSEKNLKESLSTRDDIGLMGQIISRNLDDLANRICDRDLQRQITPLSETNSLHTINEEDRFSRQAEGTQTKGTTEISPVKTIFEFRGEFFTSNQRVVHVNATVDLGCQDNFISKEFVKKTGLESHTYENFKQRERVGPAERLVKPDQEIKLRWRPSGSIKTEVTRFFLDENMENMDMVVGQGFADLDGIFGDIPVEAYTLRIPWKGNSRKERQARKEAVEKHKREEKENETRQRTQELEARKQRLASASSSSSIAPSALSGSSGNYLASTLNAQRMVPVTTTTPSPSSTPGILPGSSPSAVRIPASPGGPVTMLRRRSF
ncbi:uncharacterized protein K452DRAFT_306853 [Aplosporella prunicola CBS 121167]|uniref:Uncharacterized protein n=1 Tax=Aplosporella prunicola CBS 121167 TaxID=1176127 RepID=A0A6A6BLU1_9PEZI|nr:uncharacterized protein K452DRAFT_306853 [Aplosporella prunicola CBS 121167]KAF2144254.1 hypothetical protein K452DRAFT_306853 [Aplosporella prunicola CBS 121167]